MSKELIIVLSLVNTNFNKNTDPFTGVQVSAYEMNKGNLECVFTDLSATDTTNTTFAAYEGLVKFFLWLSQDALYRNSVSLHLVCKDKNTNSSFIKLSKTFHTLESSWTATKQMFLRMSPKKVKIQTEYGVDEMDLPLQSRIEEYIKKMLRSNHKALDEITNLQTAIIYTMLDVLKPRFGELKLWAINLKELWKDEGFSALRDVVKTEQVKVIRTFDNGKDVPGLKKYQKRGE